MIGTEVVLLCGVAGAGKTTYARTLERSGYLRLSYDEEMWALGHDSRTAPPEVLAAADEKVRARLREAVAAGTPVVLDASLSTRAIRDEFRALVRAAGGTPRLVLVDAPAAVVDARMRERAARDDADALHLDPAASRAYRDAFEFPADDEPHDRIRSSA